MLTLALACTPDPSVPLTPVIPVAIESFTVTPDLEQPTELAAAATLDADAAITVTCTTPDDPTERHTQGSPPAAAHALTFQGLLASTDYDCTLTVEGGDAQVVAVTTGAWPDEPPEVSVEGDPDRIDGYTVFNVGDLCSYVQNRLWLYDPDGRPRWTWELDWWGIGDIEVDWLGDGRMLVGGGDGIYATGDGRITEIDLAGTTYSTRSDPVDGTDYHHHVERLPTGEDLALVWTENTGPSGGFIGFGIERYDPVTQEVTWGWSSQSAVDAGTLDPGDRDEDAYHANALQWFPDDPEGESYWVSLANESRVVRIDAATGELTWRLGHEGDFVVYDRDGVEIDTEDDEFQFQHSIGVRAEGDKVLLTMHDNGLYRGSTRALDLLVDPAAREAHITWEWTEPGWREYPGGDHDVLPDGNRLLTQGHCSCCQTGNRNSTITEVDPTTDEAVWKLVLPTKKAWLYRSTRIPGCEIFANEKYCR